MSILSIRGNALGFAMFIISGLVAGVGGLVLRLEDAPVMIGVGVTLFLMDMVVRLRERPSTGWLTQKQLGGYLIFMPVWTLGILVILLNILNLFVDLN